jgi:hypothetical protein
LITPARASPMEDVDLPEQLDLGPLDRDRAWPL